VRTKAALLLGCVVGLTLGGCADLVKPPERAHIDARAHLEKNAQKTEALAEHNEALRSGVDYGQPVVTRPADPAAGEMQTWQPNATATGGGLTAGVARSSRDPTAIEEPRFQVDMDFREVSLTEFVEVLFKEYLQAPFTIAGDFKDRKINVVFHGELSRSELFDLLESLLQFHGVFVKYANGVYAISDSAKKPVPQNAPERFGYTTGVFKLNFLRATDFIVIARQFLTDPTLAKPMDEYNMAVISAPAPEVEAVRNLLLSLDVPFFEGKYVLLYTPRHVSAGALKALLEKYTSLLGSTAKGVQRQIESATLPNQNRLIIVAHDRTVKQLIEEFIRYTDAPQANRRQIFQYPLTSQKAVDIAPSVKKLADTIFGTEVPVDVVADKASNSLFIAAEPEKFAELSKLLRRMDYRPPAVHIDVTLIEVTLNDRLRYGVEWFLTRANSNAVADATLDLSVGIASGLDLGLVSLTSNKFLALELLKGETDFIILSNPQVIVRNGSTARINIGQEIAIASATLATDTAGSSTQTSFTRRDVSITFEVTPDIRLDGTILMNFALKDERDAGVDNNDPPQPVFNKREVATDLVAYDGQTIFIGGILQRAQQNTVSKIPEVGDVPYLGTLFSNKDDREVQTELVIFLTPKLILDDIGTELVNRAVLSLSEHLGGDPPQPAEEAPQAPPVGGT